MLRGFCYVKSNCGQAHLPGYSLKSEGMMAIFQAAIKDCREHSRIMDSPCWYSRDILGENNKVSGVARQQSTPALRFTGRNSRTYRKMIKSLSGGKALLSVEDVFAARLGASYSSRHAGYWIERLDGDIGSKSQVYPLVYDSAKKVRIDTPSPPVLADQLDIRGAMRRLHGGDD